MSVKKMTVQNPVLKKGEHYLTSDYKLRSSRKTHNGVDLVGASRSIDDVIAIADGLVITSTYSKTAGYYVEIQHQNNYISRYLHMQKGSLSVRKGDYVQKGTILGRMGNTGNSNGAHLHFAIYNKERIPLDPLPYLLGELNFQTNPHQEFVMQVQKAFQAKVDGIAGPETLRKTITISAQINHKHPVVKAIQQYLFTLGYKEVGTIDGIAGDKFTKAIKHLQKNNDCVVDGIITRQNKTWQVLLKLN